MKKLIIGLILSVFMSNHVFANIDESQTDLYYANGMLMELSEVEAEDAWETKVNDLKEQNPKFKKINAKIAYNSSALGGADDAFESYLQWMEEKNIAIAWETVVGSIPVYLEVLLEIADFSRNPVLYLLERVGLPTGAEALTFVDLNTQINAYKQSIKDGHGVIVVAHSQGNFFTNKAFLELDDWMRPYFNMIGVASPSSLVVKNGPRVSFDNDFVAHFSGVSGKIINPNRARRTVTDNRGTTLVDLPNFVYHPFDYYMGDAVTVTDLEQEITVSTTVAKDRIVAGILDALDQQALTPSQWKKVNDVGCLCSEKRITIAHKFDSNLDSNMAGQAVYAFDDDAKVYPVSGDHVFAPLGGSVLESGGVGDVCYVLKDDSSVVLGEISGGNAISNLPCGLFTAQLSWEQPDVRLEMSNSLMGNSANGCGVTALGSGEGREVLYRTFPAGVKSGIYPITVTAQGYESLSDEVFSDLIKLNVSVPGQTSASEFLVTNANEYSRLGKGGTVADILITRPAPNRPSKVEFIPRLPPSTNMG